MPLMTQWGEAAALQHPLPEYPRPQLRRESYLNLNGPWEYAITDSDDLPTAFDGEIIVPFSPESALSGVSRTLLPQQTLWYRRNLALPEGFIPEGGRLILHFGAVDQEADVYVNGRHVCHHMGGYTAFSTDITDALKAENVLVVRVHDDTDQSFHSRGKQSSKRGGIWYTPQSGIWQTVWMEAVPAVHIQSLRITPLFDESAVAITVVSAHDASGMITADGRSLPFTANTPFLFPMPGFRAWSPENPHLYDLQVTLGDDHVQSYFAMRKTEVRVDEQGVKRLFLNNHPYFHNGLLDQGYWPDGLYTAPSDEAMIFDIQTAKELGYNMLRKHIKVEPMRWYYHCDRLGMLVWQDMVNGGGLYNFMTISTPLVTGWHRKDTNHKPFARSAAQGRAEYEAELAEMVNQLYSVPSLVLWVPFNEGWGQFDAERICKRLSELDPTRPIDHASGWHDQKIGDIKSLHVYFMPYRFKKDKFGRAVILSEFGGYNLRLDGHCFNDTDYGYKKLPDQQALWAAYEKLFEKEILPAIPKGLCATVYTQLTDVEDELNGIMTYDRKVVKLPDKKVRELNQKVIEAGNN